MSPIILLAIICIVSYLLGSVQTGILLSRYLKGPDLRTVGSGNTGATNVTRVMGLPSGLITFLGDCGKGILACLLGRWFLGQSGAMAAGLCVVIGHNWPVFFGFKGGKGVSTTAGVYIICYPPAALICVVIGLIVLFAFRLVSLASLTAATAFTIAVTVLCWGHWWVIAWAVVLAAMCFYRHRTNIDRLLHGTESRFTFKKSAAKKNPSAN